MYSELLEKIKIEKVKVNQKINDGASEIEISRLVEESKKYKLSVPKEYLSLLRKINGVNYNGLFLYGVDMEFCEKDYDQKISGFIDKNQIWRENMPEYIFFGDESIAWYCQEIKSGKYLELDKPSGRVMKEFKDFDEMITRALDVSLM
jgi:hypothetical protein